MKIALISLDQKWEDKASNLLRCEELTALAAGVGADLVIFPEMTLTGFSMNTRSIAEDCAQSPTVAAFGRLAREYSISAVAGVAIRNGDLAQNTLVAFGNDGAEKARYVKIHPFSFAGEDKIYQRGNRLSKMNMPEFQLGFSICYDLRFPELYSALAKDCEVLINIANWPQKRVGHWKTLLQARAIENQVFVIGVNRTGKDANELEYAASSSVINANGEFVNPIYSENELDIYEISRQELIQFRRSFSTRQDRLPDLYREFI